MQMKIALKWRIEIHHAYILAHSTGSCGTTLAKTEIIYPKNVRAEVAMDFI